MTAFKVSIFLKIDNLLHSLEDKINLDRFYNGKIGHIRYKYCQWACGIDYKKNPDSWNEVKENKNEIISIKD